MKTKLLLVFMLLPLIVWAEPSPVINSLMKESVTVFDFGLLNIQVELNKITEPGLRFSTTYDYNTDRIVISCVGKSFKNENEAKEFARGLAGKIKALFLAPNPKGKKEFLLAPLFTASSNKPKSATVIKELEEKLKNVVDIQMTFSFEEEEKGLNEIAGKTRLTENDVIFTIKSLK